MKIANEKDVKAAVKKLLDKHSWFWFFPPANGYGKAGIADIIALKAGVFLAIETKFGKNKPTKLQCAFLLSVQSESGFGFVVNEDTLQWFEAWLESFENATAAATKGEMPDSADGATLIDAQRYMTADIA